jgi:diguanylate cyclase (GGDEF)-like protein/putative nucleotidyltransferase with HDIG domain
MSTLESNPPAPEPSEKLTWLARLFLATVIVLGGLCIADAIARFVPFNLARFTLYLGISIVASVLKVRLPGIRGTMSVNFFFFLLSVVSLSLFETAAIGAFSALAQTLWKPKSRPSVERALFNVALIALALRFTYGVFHLEAIVLPVQFHLRLILTATSYFVMNTLPVAIMIHLAEKKPLIRTWRDTYFWAFSYYLVGAAFAAILSALERSMGWEAATLVLPVLYSIHRAYRLYLSQVESEKKQAELQRAHAEEVSALHLRTIQALALAIEAKDQTTHDHLRRVQVYSTELAKALGLGESDIQAIRAASLLHDIGKLAVPEHIISKPGRLTPEEFEKMKIHPIVGAEILESVQFPYPVVPIVRHHHERWDGAGYPDGLKGDEIPIGARILSAVDCLDALASDRQYRRAMPLDDAMAEVVKMAGRNFDPSIVELLRANYREWEALAHGTSPAPVRLSTEIRIERGDAPAAGFESPAPQPFAPRHAPKEFLTSIGAARHEAHTLFELTQDLSSSLALDEILSVVATRIKKLIPHDTFAVYRKEHEVLVAEVVIGDDFRAFSSLRIPLGEGLSGWVAENRKPIVNGNPAVEPGYLDDPSKFTLLRSALCLPLEVSDAVLGVLTLYSARKEAFTRDHLRVLMMIASKLSQSMHNSLQYRRAEDTSMTDFLTGLPNARSLFEHMEQQVAVCRKTGASMSVLVCDLDGFKQINDSFGHLEGNRMLQLVAGALTRNCRDRDYVARMGGDEFVMLLNDVDASHAPACIARIVSAIEDEGIKLSGEPIISASFGAAHIPEDGFDSEHLLSLADGRMYKAKNQRKLAGPASQQLLSVASAIGSAQHPEKEPAPNKATLSS